MTHAHNINRLATLALSALLVAISMGCSDLFKDPLEDKDSGNQITLLLLDRNFIKTKLAVKAVDAATGEAISNEEVEIRFSGPDASNLITFGGFKQVAFTTSTGFIEIGADPNVGISAQNPLDLTVLAISENYISAPRFLSYTTDGTKNLSIPMIRKSAGKALGGGAFSEPFDLSYNGVVSAAELDYINDISGSPTGTAYQYINLYVTTTNGLLECDNLRDAALYSDYGAYLFGAVSGFSLLPPETPSRNRALSSGDYVYSTILRSGIQKCSEGLTIHAEKTGGGAGSGMFVYLITFSDGTVQSGQITCTFPCDNLIEPIYYPASDPSIEVTLYGDAQYTMSAAIDLPSACGATASFTATPRSNLKTYQFITRYSCPDNPLGMGLSIIGEFRIGGSAGEWTFFEFVEGVCVLQLEPGTDYEFRVNIDGTYYSYTIPTDPSRVEGFLLENQNEDYQLRNLSVTNGETLVVIDAEVEFSQGVCDKLQ